MLGRLEVILHGAPEGIAMGRVQINKACEWSYVSTKKVHISYFKVFFMQLICNWSDASTIKFLTVESVIFI